MVETAVVKTVMNLDVNLVVIIQIHVQKDDLSLFMTKFTSKFTT